MEFKPKFSLSFWIVPVILLYLFVKATFAANSRYLADPGNLPADIVRLFTYSLGMLLCFVGKLKKISVGGVFTIERYLLNTAKKSLSELKYLDDNTVAFRQMKLDLSDYRNSGELKALLEQLNESGLIRLRTATDEERRYLRHVGLFRKLAVIIFAISIFAYIIFSLNLNFTLVEPHIDTLLVAAVLAAPLWLIYRAKVRMI